MTDKEQQKAAKAFAAYWKGKGDEKGESQKFWQSLLPDVYGIEHGSFYAIIFDGKMDVQPYDYKDNDISANMSVDELVAALENKTADKLGFYGNVLS